MTFGKVILTDEKEFYSTKNAPRHCWQERDIRYVYENIFEDVVGAEVFISGELTVVDEQLNSQKYIEILEESLIPSVRAYGAPHSIILIHDNSSIHQSKTVREWLAGQPDIVLVWPSKGCNMNPTQHRWAMTGSWERNTKAIIRKANELWESVRWSLGLCSRLVESMPRHLNEVITARGGWSSC